MAQTAALLPFMGRDEFTSLVQSSTFSGSVAQDLAQAWRTAAPAPTDPWTPGEDSIQPLPAGLQELERELRDSPTWQNYYEPQGCSIRMVNARTLLTYQYRVNWSRVVAMADHAPVPGDLAALFRFCCPESNVAMPLRHGNSVLFTAPDVGQVVVKMPPDLRRVDEGTYHLTLRVTSRPNFLYATVLEGRVLLLNGNHRVPALLQAGHEHLPCVLLPSDVVNPDLMGITPPLTFTLDLLLRSARPPLVADFLDRSLAPLFETPEIRGGLQVAVQTREFPFPRPR